MRVDALLARVSPRVPSVLVIVLQVEGSAPREPGASMLVTAGEVVGSIGGGRLEHAAIARARSMLEAGRDDAVVERHALGPGLGQCCGGAVTLRIATLGTDATGSSWYRELARARTRGDAAALVTIVASEHDDLRVGTRLVVTVDGVVPSSGHETEVVAAARSRLASPEAGATLVRIGPSLVALIEPDRDAHHVVVFGAGHVGRALVPILATLPGRVIWVDPRAEAFPSPPPAGVDCRVTPVPEDEVEAVPPGTSFVVLTHDHALDLRLAEAILARDDVAYFGLIGSATKRARFVRRLRMRGVAAARVASMRCPIGLPGVGGKAPAEIAVAIAAELLAHRTATVGAGAIPTRERGGA